MHKRRVILFIGFLFGLFSLTPAQSLSPFLPDTGRLAIEQNKIDLRSGLVVLSIAIAPGFEDISTLAYFRLKKGAEIGCVYLTNGEDIPNYECGKSTHETAKQRKEEAYTVISSLGGEAFFINIPASLYMSETNDSTDIDNYYLKLDKIISEMKPDVILLNSDYIFPNGKSKRRLAIEKKIEAAIRRLKIKNQWTNFEIFIQSDEINKGNLIQIDENNALRKKSYRDIADDIRINYKSLKSLLPVWKNAYQSRYVSVYPSKRSQQRLSTIDSPFIPPSLKTIAWNIKKITQPRNSRSSDDELARVQTVISQLDSYINQDQKNLSLLERRLLLYWKNTVEKYRCVLHNVHIPYTLSNDGVTALQVFYVKIGSLGPWAKNGKTQLLFPGVIQRDWIVDTRQDYFYPLKSDTSWLVLSPKVFPLTSPVTEEGYNALNPRNKFQFMIVHEESQTTNNFVYQKDIPLISVPHQSIEIMTPCVLANQDSTIIVRIKNNLFNAMDGEIHADDSLVSMQAHHIFLHPKSTAMDTLVLNWKGVCKEGEHVVAIKSKKNNSIGTFTYKGIDINAGVKRPIGIFTVVDQSPLLVALRRIGYPVITLDTVDLHCFENISTVIIDEQSSKKVDSNSNTKKQLTNWILAGGKMIVLPQFYPNEVPIPDDSVIFNYKYPIISTNDITVDTACFAFNDPNILKFKNWQNAGSAIAYGEIHVKKSMPVSIPIKSQSTKMPLMVVRHYGLGSIVYIAFNLHPQLLTIQANAYKFLVNILNN